MKHLLKVNLISSQEDRFEPANKKFNGFVLCRSGLQRFFQVSLNPSRDCKLTVFPATSRVGKRCVIKWSKKYNDFSYGEDSVDSSNFFMNSTDLFLKKFIKSKRIKPNKNGEYVFRVKLEEK